MRGEGGQRGQQAAQGLPQATAAGTHKARRRLIRPGRSGGGRGRQANEAVGPALYLLQEHGPRPVQRFQEMGYGWVLRGQEGELSGQAGSPCSLPAPPVTALGLDPCSSSPNEPPAAGKRLK